MKPDEIRSFHDKGYLVVPGLFTEEEVGEFKGFAANSEQFKDSTFSKTDGEGGSIDMALWNNTDDSLFGLFPRATRMVDRMESLIGEEIYHYHSKLVQKNPRTGGAWTWHQDYGYWYQNGLLFPDKVASVMVALDRATRENGCLQVIEGSHKMGRVKHQLSGEQAGADLEMVAAALDRLPHVYVTLEAGDALFFHSNLLHRSDQNRSEFPRWALISCYNGRSNSPFKESHHPSYSPLQKVADEDVLKGLQSPEESLDWLRHSKDESARRA